MDDERLEYRSLLALVLLWRNFDGDGITDPLREQIIKALEFYKRTKPIKKGEKMFCCDKFKKNVEEYQAPVGGGLLYPTQNPSGQFEQAPDGSWNINGCCGGGCFVVTEMGFCPFCGSKLPDNKAIAADSKSAADE